MRHLDVKNKNEFKSIEHNHKPKNVLIVHVPNVGSAITNTFNHRKYLLKHLYMESEADLRVSRYKILVFGPLLAFSTTRLNNSSIKSDLAINVTKCSYHRFWGIVNVVLGYIKWYPWILVVIKYVKFHLKNRILSIFASDFSKSACSFLIFLINFR